MEVAVEGAHVAEELTREQLMLRVNFDTRAWAALVKVFDIERSGGYALIRYCRNCGWMVTEERHGLPS